MYRKILQPLPQRQKNKDMDNVKLTAIEGAESQVVQRLPAATARTASAPPAVIVVTT